MFDPLFLHYLDITILIFYKENTVQLSLWSEGLTGQIKLARQRRALGFYMSQKLSQTNLFASSNQTQTQTQTKLQYQTLVDRSIEYQIRTESHTRF